MKKSLIYLILHLLMLAFSFVPVFSKLAGQHPFLSWGFILFYGLSLFILVVYAFGWQQVIKRMPLTAAYANKAITVVWGMVWGLLIFSEAITWQRVAGAAVIILGVVLYALPTNKERMAELAATIGEEVAKDD